MADPNDDDVLRFLENKRDEVERHLARLNAAIAALRSFTNERPPLQGNSQGVIPPIVDICQYLGKQARPTAQGDIIRVVGELRQKRYPALSNHYSNVWRALEYHVRHGRMISCVNQDGQPVKLKPLPHRPKNRKLTNSPALYEQDNYFMLKEELDEDGPRQAQSNRSLFGQD